MSKEIKRTAIFSVLMGLAGELGRAKKLGDPDAIAKAQAEHDAYKDICLSADKVLLEMNMGYLDSIKKGTDNGPKTI